MIFFKIYLTKEKSFTNNSANFLKYLFPMTIILFVFAFFMISNVSLFEKEKNWYIINLPITNKYETINSSGSGTRKTIYYVTTNENINISVTKDLYDKLEIGENVYVLKDNENNSLKIYSQKEYIYKGTRIKQKKQLKAVLILVVPKTGVEPVRSYKDRRILSPVRLPISPLRHNGAKDEIRTRDPRLGKAMLYH